MYDSDNFYMGAHVCSGGFCTLEAEVVALLHEYVIGVTSHTWQLTMSMREVENPHGLTWSFSAAYWCGVNVRNATDHLCTNGAAPSDVFMSVNTVVNKPWGSANGITVFPMVQASTFVQLWRPGHSEVPGLGHAEPGQSHQAQHELGQRDVGDGTADHRVVVCPRCR